MASEQTDNFGQEKEIVHDISLDIGDLEEWSFDYGSDGEYVGEIYLERMENRDGPWCKLVISTGSVGTTITFDSVDEIEQFTDWIHNAADPHLESQK